jgi:hypothetical protein
MSNSSVGAANCLQEAVTRQHAAFPAEDHATVSTALHHLNIHWLIIASSESTNKAAAWLLV